MSVTEVVGALALVLVSGTFGYWVVRPGRRPVRQAVLLAQAGLVVLAVGALVTAVQPALAGDDGLLDALARPEGLAALLRLAVLAAVGGFSTDLFGRAVRGSRAVALTVASLALAASFVVPLALRDGTSSAVIGTVALVVLAAGPAAFLASRVGRPEPAREAEQPERQPEPEAQQETASVSSEAAPQR